MKTRLLLFPVCLSVMLSVVAHAALIPFELEGPNATWVQSNYGTSPGEPGGIVELAGESWLLTGRGSSGSRVTGYYYNAGDSGATDNNQFSDFTGSVIFMGTDGTGAGIAGRGIAIRAPNQNTNNGANNAFRHPNQYLIQQRHNGLGIYYGVGDAFDSQVPPSSSYALAYTSFRDEITWQADTQYQITFSVIGSVIEADIWLWDAVNNVPIGESLAHVIYTEATERETGYVGLRGFRLGNSDLYSYYRDFNITRVIPEPGFTVAAVLLVLAGAVFRLRGKRK